jgi:glutaredoxin 3
MANPRLSPRFDLNPKSDMVRLTTAPLSSTGCQMSAPLILFVKTGCPWCDMAEEWLQDRDYKYQAVDVLSDGAAFDEMIRLSGQRRAPTLKVGTLILADFGPDELADFLKKHSIKP